MVDPADVLDAFGLPADAPLEALAGGHINESYRVRDAGGTYVLQRINGDVFPDPAAVADNTARISDHLGRSAPGLVPGQRRTARGESHVRAGDAVFRLCWFVDGRAPSRLVDAHECHAAGAAFGRFQHALADFDGRSLAPAIPGFHVLGTYLAAFRGAVDAATPERLAAAQPLLEDVGDGPTDPFPGASEGVIHGDCKVNNLIFDRAGANVLAVVDLDTAMWGRLAWDFGDLARSAVALGGEESLPAEVSMSLFRALTQGYVGAAGELVPLAERRDLAAAPGHMAFMLGLRFLTDHLRGDRYFHGAPGQNLRRATAQIALARRFAGHERQMRRILEEV